MALSQVKMGSSTRASEGIYASLSGSLQSAHPSPQDSSVCQPIINATLGLTHPPGSQQEFLDTCDEAGRFDLGDGLFAASSVGADLDHLSAEDLFGDSTLKDLDASLLDLYDENGVPRDLSKLCELIPVADTRNNGSSESCQGSLKRRRSHVDSEYCEDGNGSVAAKQRCIRQETVNQFSGLDVAAMPAELPCLSEGVEFPDVLDDVDIFQGIDDMSFEADPNGPSTRASSPDSLFDEQVTSPGGSTLDGNVTSTTTEQLHEPSYGLSLPGFVQVENTAADTNCQERLDTSENEMSNGLHAEEPPRESLSVHDVPDAAADAQDTATLRLLKSPALGHPAFAHLRHGISDNDILAGQYREVFSRRPQPPRYIVPYPQIGGPLGYLPSSPGIHVRCVEVSTDQVAERMQKYRQRIQALTHQRNKYKHASSEWTAVDPQTKKSKEQTLKEEVTILKRRLTVQKTNTEKLKREAQEATAWRSRFEQLARTYNDLLAQTTKQATHPVVSVDLTDQAHSNATTSNSSNATSLAQPIDLTEDEPDPTRGGGDGGLVDAMRQKNYSWLGGKNYMRGPLISRTPRNSPSSDANNSNSRSRNLSPIDLANEDGVPQDEFARMLEAELEAGS